MQEEREREKSLKYEILYSYIYLTVRVGVIDTHKILRQLTAISAVSSFPIFRTQFNKTNKIKMIAYI
jgi:2-keto-3-deoxy-L-rhamnonate aldolase RhmA